MNKISRKEFLRLAVTAGLATAAAPLTIAQSASRSIETVGSRSTLIRGADVLSMDPELGEAPDTDVFIADGRIAAIGRNLHHHGAEVVDAHDMILMPGMIDGHRHVWEILDLGRLVATEPATYSRYQEWKMRTVVCMTPEDHYLAGLIGGLQAIDSGVTCVLDYAHGQGTEEAAVAAAQGLRDSGIAGWFALQLGVSFSYGPGDTLPMARASSERVAQVTERHWQIAKSVQSKVFLDRSAPLRFALAPSNAMGSSLHQIRSEWAQARSLGAELLALHVHKPQSPTAAGTMGHRDSGIRDLHEAGLLGPDVHITHGNRLTSDELELLRESGGMLCATAMGEFPNTLVSFRGASSHGRARAAGVSTGIGIDAPLMLPLDYFEHARAAYWSLYLEEEGRKIVESYKSHDTLDFVTALGAQSVRLGNEVGSITVGKRADLVLLRTDRLAFGAVGTLSDRVLTFGTTQDVDSVWIAGEARKRNGKLLNADWQDLRMRLRKAQARVGDLAKTITFT